MSGVPMPAGGAQESEEFEELRPKTDGAAIPKGEATSEPYSDDDFESSEDDPAPQAADAEREQSEAPGGAESSGAAPAAADGGGAEEPAAPLAAALAPIADGPALEAAAAGSPRAPATPAGPPTPPDTEDAPEEPAAPPAPAPIADGPAPEAAADGSPRALARPAGPPAPTGSDSAEGEVTVAAPAPEQPPPAPEALPQAAAPEREAGARPEQPARPPAVGAPAPAPERPAPAPEAPAPEREAAPAPAPDPPAPASAPALGARPAGGDPQAENPFSVSGVRAPLHLAAKSGSAPTVRFLLKNGADPADADANGQTALEVAEAAGHAEVCSILREALRIPPKEAAEAPETESAEARVQGRASKGPPVEANGAQGGRVPAELPPVSCQEAKPSTSSRERPVLPRQIRTAPARTATSGGPSRSPSSPGGFQDLKRIASTLSDVTTDGVKRGATYMGSLSGCRSSPKFTIGGLPRNSSVTRSSSTPAPGTYDVISHSGDIKYTQQPNFSFGRGPSRFGTPPRRSRCEPGPGAYSPKDPARSVSVKAGFGSSRKFRSAATAKEHPGPGAYEIRSTIGEGRACRARGRFVAPQLSITANPGPGTYDPSTYFTLAARPKTGFGTSRRGGEGRLAELAPGPGTYDLQNAKGLGTDAPQFSVTSRRRRLEIESYLTPGPGSYNSHLTCFGGP